MYILYASLACQACYFVLPILVGLVVGLKGLFYEHIFIICFTVTGMVFISFRCALLYIQDNIVIYVMNLW